MSDSATGLMGRLPLRRPGWAPWWPTAGFLLRLAVVVVALVLPFYLQTSLLQTGLFAMSAIVGAIGLNLLTGATGQLSLAHAFFLAIGAYGYAYFAGHQEVQGTNTVHGLGLPPLVAAILATLVAGVAGGLFSPISGRLRGIYLGIASLALVFIGQHLLFNASAVTGGFYGRTIPAFTLGPLEFKNKPVEATILGVPFGRYERLWYLFLVVVIIAYVVAKNIMRGRPGRAMNAIRDSETAAAVMGVNVIRYKAAAFVVSSMYAGLAGVLFGLAFLRVVPDSFGFTLSIDFLAMIVIGGLGSIGGAAVGAVFVAALPQLLTQYSDKISFLAQPGSGGVDPGTFSRFVYGGAIVLVILFEPGGLAAMSRRVPSWWRRRAAQRVEAPSAGHLPGTGPPVTTDTGPESNRSTQTPT